jgi:thioredoxin 1
MSNPPPSEHSRVRPLETAKLQETLAANEYLLVVFYAEWCAPCRSFLETLDRLAVQHVDVQFSLVDVERQPELAAAFQVHSVPKIAVLRSGAIVFAHEGALTDEAVTDVLTQVRTLDMDALRRVARSSASSPALG